ncbi:branched-chain amino acid ABC transporter permease [Agrococcus baldri]|uniref:Branched-chain amino acid ABC transporter permease n=1 Tax=Agrococcus baldri TaxID=153730 RepID=A0AA87R9M2_9MICO|nr:branched-chain amino acid ABC transporter permease [Agrococcus baldri]GEK79114.1 branched-chain amino acid ABC transporter permease [Agrococcus baldri]
MISWLAYYDDVIGHMFVLMILAFSMYVVMRVGVFSVASIGFWAIAGYGAAIADQYDVPPLLIVGGALLVSGVFGLLLALLAVRLSGLSLTMVTIAFVLLLQVIVLNWEDVTGGSLGIFGLPVHIGTYGLLAVVIVVAVLLALYERGRTGRAQDSLLHDEQLAQSVGIDIRRQRIVALTLSALLGGLAGCLNVFQTGMMVSNEVGFHVVVDALTMVILGGTAAWYGPVIGAAILAWLPQMLSFADEWRLAVQGVIIVVVLVFAPQGAAGLIQRLARGVAAKRRSSLLKRREPQDVSA